MVVQAVAWQFGLCIYGLCTNEYAILEETMACEYYMSRKQCHEALEGDRSSLIFKTHVWLYYSRVQKFDFR